jgi:hypothetical protein
MFRIGAILFILGASLFSIARVVVAVDQSSPNYQNIGGTFAPAVQNVSSPSYQMTASIDAIVGKSTSANYVIQNGVPINDTNPIVCGNGIVESGEACDNGGSNGSCPQTCSTSCTTNSCGGGWRRRRWRRRRWRRSAASNRNWCRIFWSRLSAKRHRSLERWSNFFDDRCRPRWKV